MNFVTVAIVSAIVLGHPLTKSCLLIGLNHILLCLNHSSHVTKISLYFKRRHLLMYECHTQNRQRADYQTKTHNLDSEKEKSYILTEQAFSGTSVANLSHNHQVPWKEFNVIYHMQLAVYGTK